MLEKIFKKIITFFRKINFSRNDYPIDFVGSNWQSDEKMPIAVLFRFNPWKRDFISAFLSDHKTAFVFGKTGYRRVKKHFLKKLPPDQKVVFVSWGRKLELSWYARIEIKLKKIPIYSIEDGFLRSVGNGLLHTRPSSLCLDRKGIYFDATRASDIESILNDYNFKKSPDLLVRAKTCIELFRAARLTKYYDTRPYPSSNEFKRTNKYSILVIGQVEDDASIKKGKVVINRNVDLVLRAKKDFPDADIYFRPHPDFWAGNRKGYSNIKKVSSICAIVPPESSVYELFEVVDHVYTMTSLAGFEALLNGLKVTTFGTPFYAGWGLTDDRARHISRRRGKRTIEELFAAAYLIYPRYIHQNSDEKSSFEQTASYFIVDLLKDENIFDLHVKSRLFQNVLQYKNMLATPFKLLVYLNSTGNFAAGNTQEIISLLTENFNLADYPQVIHLLHKTSNYDALVEYSNFCVNYLAENIALMRNNTTLLEEFFYHFSIALSNANGRRINGLPDVGDFVLSIPGNNGKLKKIFEHYINSLAFNLQYDVIDSFIEAAKLKNNDEPKSFRSHWEIEDFIGNALKVRLSPGNYKILAQILRKKPTRSERDFAKRQQLILSFAKSYIEALNDKFIGPADAIFNQLLYWLLLEEYSRVKELFSELGSFLEEMGEQAFHDFVMSRRKDFLAFAQICIKHGYFGICEKILEALPEKGRDASDAFLRMNYLKSKGDEAKFLAYYNELPKEIRGDEKITGVYARYLREAGFFERATQFYLDMYKKARTVAKKNSVIQEVQKLEFCLESSSILNSVAQPKLPKGVIFLASQTCFNTLAMMIPSLVELKKKGYAVVNLMAGMTEYEPTGIKYIDRFAGIIPLRLSFYGLKNEWNIHWEEQTVSVGKINFYQGFYERLSTYARRFHVDINAPLINRIFNENLVRADTCLHICEQVYLDVVSRGIPVAFVSGNSHVTPFSVFRDFARHKDHPLLSFINCNVAYESYFSNLGSKFANTMCVTDMTLYPNIRAPFMARKDLFDRWYENNKNNQEYIEKAKALINVNRVGSTSNEKELEIIEYIKTQKSLGKRIVCAFGKVPVDLNVPYDGGPAHKDMADWISHTVEICGESDNIILLVKPHPHELRPEIALDLVESFHDLITSEVKENVHLLGHKDINGHALAPYLDLAILYNGSSSLELAAQGIPVLLASYFGKHDYPVELNYPISRESYREFILSGSYPIPSEELRKKSAFLMCYLGTEEISILNQYSIRQLTNDKIGVPKWRKEKINNFLKNGDPKMRLIADRIVEKFEKKSVN